MGSEQLQKRDLATLDGGPAARQSDTVAAQWGAMTTEGLHHPVIGQRRKGSTRTLLRHVRDYWAIYAKHRVDPVFREEIMLSVAGANSSRQCSFAHREWARAEHISEDELAALESLDTEELDELKLVAFAWAQAYARSDLTEVPADVAATFMRSFSEQERADVELAARTMYWLNETSNGVDAFLLRTRHHPVPGSTRRSEFLALVLYAIAFPLLMILFSIKQPRSPFALMRGIEPFFREFESRGPNTISGPGIHFAG